MIHYLFGEITNDWLTLARIQYEFPIFFANSLTIPFELSLLWIHHLFREFTFNSRIHFEFISFSRIHNLFFELTLNSLFFPEFTFNSLFTSRIHFQFTISLRIHFLVREFTISFANSLRIHYFFQEFFIDSLYVSDIQNWSIFFSGIDNLPARSLS